MANKIIINIIIINIATARFMFISVVPQSIMLIFTTIDITIFTREQ